MPRALVLAVMIGVTGCGGRPAGTGGPLGDAGAAADGSAGIADGGRTDAGITDGGPADAGVTDGGGGDAGSPDGGPAVDPVQIFGSRYWNVYRPAFFARFYDHGRVTDRIENGTKMYGDGTIWVANLLSTMVFEYEAAHLQDSLRVVSELLAQYQALDRLWGDPLDGYVYRSDRGPDYQANWLPNTPPQLFPNNPLLKNFYGTRDDEPSGDQILGTLRALSDVVSCPEPLVYQGTDLKAEARARAALLGGYLKRVRYQMLNAIGDRVKRGPDQRWASWSFAHGAASIAGLAPSSFVTTWDIGGVPIPTSDQHDVALWFVEGCWDFSVSCQGGRSINVAGIPVTVSCNQFNMDLGGDAGVISLSADPTSPDWFPNWVAPSSIEAEGNALYAMYARYRFGDKDPALAKTAARFLDAPATPPTSDDQDPNGWCVPWRWAKDYANPNACTSGQPGTDYTGLDYMICRAFASANGEFPE